MAIDVNKDKAVVVISKDNVTIALGYPHLYSAIATVERQILKPELAFDAVVEAMDKGTEIDGATFRIMETEIYLDTYEDNDDEI